MDEGSLGRNIYWMKEVWARIYAECRESGRGYTLAENEQSGMSWESNGYILKKMKINVDMLSI
ncbi:hypothetical protein ACTQ1U_14695 [Thermoguttaceae bacterium LCP21S3_D4]